MLYPNLKKLIQREIKMNRLKELRIKNNLKQQDIANMLHITQPNYSNYENGRIPLNMDYAIILSHFYGVSLGYLLDDSLEDIQISKEDFETLKKARDIINKLDHDK